VVNLAAEVEVANETPEGGGDPTHRAPSHPTAALNDEGIELARREVVYWYRFSTDVLKKPANVQAVLPDGRLLDASVPP
jgi:hypothetical protein